MKPQREWTFDPVDLAEEGEQLRRRGRTEDAYMAPLLGELKNWAKTAGPSSQALVTALVHHGWSTGGMTPCRASSNKSMHARLRAHVAAGELPSALYEVGKPTAPQVVGCMERLQAAGAPLGALLELWECYTGGVAAKESTANTSPEVDDAVVLADEAAGRTPSRARRMSAADHKAIEVHAVAAVTRHYEDLGYEVKDVGATESYDLDVRRGEEHLYVEVKGTTGSGEAVVLTKNEVHLHREKYPNNALAVFRRIRLEDSEQPECSGGELALFQPWQVDDDALTALSYSYVTGIAHQ